MNWQLLYLFIAALSLFWLAYARPLIADADYTDIDLVAEESRYDVGHGPAPGPPQLNYGPGAGFFNQPTYGYQPAGFQSFGPPPTFGGYYNIPSGHQHGSQHFKPGPGFPPGQQYNPHGFPPGQQHSPHGFPPGQQYSPRGFPPGQHHNPHGHTQGFEPQPRPPSPPHKHMKATNAPAVRPSVPPKPTVPPKPAQTTSTIIELTPPAPTRTPAGPIVKPTPPGPTLRPTPAGPIVKPTPPGPTVRPTPTTSASVEIPANESSTTEPAYDIDIRFGDK